MGMVTFLSKSNRVIEVPDWDLSTIRIFTLQKLRVLSPAEASGFSAQERREEEKARVTFNFYPPYETLLTLVGKVEPSGVFDAEEMGIVVKTIPGYETMDVEECLAVFLYMQKRQEWLQNAANN